MTTALCSKCARTLSHCVNNFQKMLKQCTNSHLTLVDSHSCPTLTFTLSGKGKLGIYGKLRICDTFLSAGLLCSRRALPSSTLAAALTHFLFLLSPSLYVTLCDSLLFTLFHSQACHRGHHTWPGHGIRVKNNDSQRERDREKENKR